MMKYPWKYLSIPIAALTAAVILSCIAPDTDSQNVQYRFLGGSDRAPYSFKAGDVPHGCCVDLMRLLAPVINKNITVELLPWEECLEEIKAGRADGLIGSPVTPKAWSW